MTPAENRQSRLDTINAYLDANSLDGVLLARRDNFSWSTGGAHNHVAQPTAVGCFPILFTRSGPTVIVDNIEGPRIRDEMDWDAVNYEVYPFFSPGGASEAIAKVVGATDGVGALRDVLYMSANLSVKEYIRSQAENSISGAMPLAPWIR